MNTEQVIQALKKKFREPLHTGSKRRIVFWYDSEQGFTDFVDTIDIKGVKVHKLSNNNFETKYLLEHQDTESDYLVYADFAQPANHDNWLLDILLYSDIFSADKASVIYNDLRFENNHLKTLIKENISFFNNKARYSALKEIAAAEWADNDLYLGMMAVICKVKHPGLELIVKTILLNGLSTEENKVFKQISKWPGESVFWDMVNKQYSYESSQPTLKGLMITLLVTHFYATSRVNIPDTWELYTSANKNECHLFIDHWLNHKKDSEVFDTFSLEISGELNFKKYIKAWEIESYIEADTFEDIDKSVILYVINALNDGMNEYDTYIKYIDSRKTKHYYDKYKNIYIALENTIKMFMFRNQYQTDFPDCEPGKMISLYCSEYYIMDTYYRKFYEAYDKVEEDILKNLKSLVESLYRNWFLEHLSPIWLKRVKENVIENWSISGIDKQQDFYKKYINPVIRNSNKDKVFVIISDALRYEAMVELKEMLDQDTRGKIKIKPVLGMIPSYTHLGMAGLLPYKEMTMNDKGQIICDGMSTAGIADRNKILQKTSPESVAYRYDELFSLPQDEAREKLKNYRVVYVYHNTIDAHGDDAKTERRTFESVNDALKELTSAVKKVVNSWNFSYVLVTADHGFLYNRDSLEESDKINKMTGKKISASRRFIITDEVTDVDGIITINMNYILKTNKPLYAMIPQGNIRYKIQGAGGNYVHGGASLQEIVIPVLTFQNVRKEYAKETDINKPVNVELISTARKVTNNNFTLIFFQTKNVVGKRKARTLKIALWDMEGTPKMITQEKTLIADKTEAAADERQFRIPFTLKSGKYDKTKTYYLRIIDSEHKLVEDYQRIPFQINVAITNDFDDF